MRFSKWFMLIVLVGLIGVISACSANNNDGQVSEGEGTEQAESDIEKNGDIITIGDKTFTYEDLDFYKLMNKVKIELQLEKDLEELAGEEAEERTKYWHEQLSYYDHFNANLQSLIEFYSMSLLAEEKNYFVPEEKLEKLVSEYNEMVTTNKQAQKLISEFGESKYKYHLREYVRQITLRDRIATELEKEIKEENTDLSEHEVNYLLGQKYENLYEDQVASLELNIHIE